MQPFVTVSGAAAPFPAANVDTDVIMPKQFLKGIDRKGLARGAFHDLRFDSSGSEKSDFVLHRPGWRDSRFLIVGPNFGCGSSREHAVWGLLQLGIRALIGTNFAGIFFDNCARNGLLAIELDEGSVEALMRLASDASTNQLRIDLPSQTIHPTQGPSIRFPVEAGRREALIKGLDPIGQTLQDRDTIAAFERNYLAQIPWLA
jgi:3-isopropylmalate/(R)-2-methylmalate dehydratase small subunit